MKMSFLITASLINLAILTSCSKYEEGGLISKADKRIVNSWKLDKYLRNSTDETSTVKISGYTETYSDAGVYTQTYTDGNGKAQNETGTYKFDNDDKEVDVSGVSSLQEFSEVHSTLSGSTYTIIKLKKDEFWYSYTNGGDSHEFRFTAQ